MPGGNLQLDLQCLSISDASDDYSDNTFLDNKYAPLKVKMI